MLGVEVVDVAVCIVEADDWNATMMEESCVDSAKET